MGIDASIYNNIRPVQAETPNPMDYMQKSMTLSQMGMQQAQAMRQMQQQQAMMQAYQQNTDPTTGQVNKQGVLSQLGKMGMGHMVPELGAQFSKQDEEAAKAQAAQSEALQKRASIFANHMNYLSSVPENQRGQAWSATIKQLKDQGVVTPDQGIPDAYDPQMFNGFAVKAQQHLGQNSKDYLENQKTKSETAMAPAKMNAEIYGSRSPNAELSSQYGKDVAPIRNSQMFMQQMLDSYKNKTPQGDAALVLNNFKIRNPQAVDVNSIEEMKNSQAVPDVWKNRAAQALKGGFDDNTRDNLIRDGISAYRANMESYKGIKERYDTRAHVQNVNDPSLTYEPALYNTHKEAMALQDKVGPYVPPTERDGTLLSAGTRLMGRLMGAGPEGAANAGEKAAPAKTDQKPQQSVRPQGAKVSDQEIGQYAIKHKMSAAAAKAFLKGHGYAVD